MPDDPTDVPLESLLALELAGRASGGVERRVLYAAMNQFSPERIEAAIASFVSVGVARATPKRVYPSDALARLDALGLICV